MSALASAKPEPDLILAKAALNAAKALGLTQEELGRVIGRDRTRISSGINPGSKSGELALLFIRCYRSLFALMGGDEANMRYWFETLNLHTQGLPREQVQQIQGLTRVVEYLDALRGKI